MNRRKGKGKPIGGAFIAHPVAMRESVAWRHLPWTSRLVLDVLELEHMRHDAKANGKLPATYSDFTGRGIRQQSVAVAIRIAVALGFIRVTRVGTQSVSRFRNPSLYRLTYLISRDDDPKRTNEWEIIKTDEQALQAIQGAKAERSEKHVVRSREAHLRRAGDRGVSRAPVTGISR